MEDIRLRFLRNTNEPAHLAAWKGDTKCGIPADGFIWSTTTPFRGWTEVLCDECGRWLDEQTL